MFTDVNRKKIDAIIKTINIFEIVCFIVSIILAFIHKNEDRSEIC